jgi:glycosyltransferase involved in cell wall biosynthesis
MLRYTIKFDEYFTEYFRKSSKIRSREIPPRCQPERFISVVTTCMNRLLDIKQTLPKNIDDNQEYPAEFVLLDYSSTDGLEEWIKSEMTHHIKSGKLVYCKVLEQQYFKHNHSRNVSFRMARGEIVTNVDSDNYMHQGFLKIINQCADNHVLVVPESFLKSDTNRLILRGRFAVTRKDLYQLGGFDEDMDRWGYSHDDTSFVCRAMLDGFYLSRFDDRFLEGRIDTPLTDRLKNTKEKNYNKIRSNNARITADKLSRGVITVNRGRGWGEATVIKNFTEVITLTGAPSI